MMDSWMVPTLQQVDRSCVPALWITPIAAGQLACGLAQHALDAAAGQIRQAVGVEKGKAVFQRVLVAQAGGEGCGGDGVERERVGGALGGVALAGR